MLCIQTRCHKLRSFIDHHRENLFTALVNYLISLRSTMRFPADGRLRAALQLKTNSPIHSLVNRPWRIHLCSEAFSFNVILNIRLSPECPVCASLRQKDPDAHSCAYRLPRHLLAAPRRCHQLRLACGCQRGSGSIQSMFSCDLGFHTIGPSVSTVLPIESMQSIGRLRNFYGNRGPE